MSAPPPRICHLSTVHRPDDVRILVRECCSLVEAGYEVHLVIRDAEPGIHRGVHVHPIRVPRQRLARLLLGPWMALRAVRDVAADLYHYHDPELIGLGWWLQHVRRRPVVFDVHECVWRQLRSKPYLPSWAGAAAGGLYRLAEHVLTRGQVKVVANEASVADYPGCTLVRNFPRLRPEILERERRFDTAPATLIYLGNLAPIRGAYRYLDLARRLRDRGRDLRLVLIGEHSEALDRDLRARVRAAGLDDRVEITGRLDWFAALDRVAQATIGLCLLDPVPNYTTCLATKILEYLMAGTPVLASDFAPWRPYVTETGSGVLVDPTDADAVAAACLRMLDEPETLAAMSRRGRAAVRERWHWDREFEGLRTCYERALGRGPAA